MISTIEKQTLQHEVEQFLKNNYQLEPCSISKIIDIILQNWFDELNDGGSHLTPDLIADNIADIASRYPAYSSQ